MIRPATSKLVVWLLGALGLAAFWRLHPVWREVPEYEYGWWVPLLAAVLIARRLQDAPHIEPPDTRGRAPGWLLSVTGLALMFFARPFLEVSPLWPVPLWLHTGGAILAGTGVLLAAGGRPLARHFIPALLFIASAAPWPTRIVQLTVDYLRPAIAWLVAECMNLAGHPALWEGTTISLANARVGVEEACSGLRSLQAAVMMAWFLGEFLRFSTGRRLGLIACGGLIAFGTNFLRALFLTWETATRGEAALAAWHDSAGYTLLTICLGLVCAVAWRWRRHAHAPGITTAPTLLVSAPPFAVRLALTLVLALATTEIATVSWFNYHEHHRSDGPVWTVAPPTGNPTYRPIDIPAASRALLRSDFSLAGEWQEPDGSPRALYFFRWDRGQAGNSTPQMHTPDVCLPLSGAILLDQWTPPAVTAGGHRLEFTALRFSGGSKEFLVFYCLWRRRETTFDLYSSPPGWWQLHWADIRAGRRGKESQSLMLVMPATPDRASAEKALHADVARWVTIQK